MGRKRKPGSEGLPPRVYPGKSAYEFRPKTGGTVRLCALDAPMSVIWTEYEKLVKPEVFTLAMLAGRYFLSPQYRQELSPRTQKDYAEYWSRLAPVFGEAPPDKLKAPHIRRYVDLRSARVQANRELVFLRRLYAWGLERGHCSHNPARDVKAFTEQARERYITDAEYMALLDAAEAFPLVRAAMEISYRCAARIGDVLRLTESQLSDAGIFIRQGKTGKKQIKRWSVPLKAAVDLAKSQPSSIRTMIVIHDSEGQPIKQKTFDSWFQKVKTAAGLKDADIHFHDIKAKGISDFEGDKQQFSGHKTAAMVGVYDRKIQVVDTLDKDWKK